MNGTAALGTSAVSDIPQLLKARAEEHGARPFLIWHPFDGGPRTWTYASFAEVVEGIAAGSAARGIGLGDRVLLHSDNCPEMVFSWYACARLGAIAVTSNTQSTASEFAWLVECARARTVIFQQPYIELIDFHRAAFDCAVRIGGQEQVEVAKYIAFNTLAIGDSPAFARDADPMLPAGIMFTSGTTGRPKPVLHSHGNYLWAGSSGAQAIGFGANDIHYAQMPFFHTNAQLWTAAVALSAGGAFVLVPRYTVRGFWPIVEQHGITHAALLPLLTGTIAPVASTRHRARTFTGAGEVSRRYAEDAGGRLVATYGMSETVSATIIADTATPWPKNCLGQAVPGYEVRVTDLDTGAPCDQGVAGELQVKGKRGVQLFLGYADDPSANAKAFTRDGWFRTGDFVRVDAEGNYNFEDRGSDRLKVGGENVSAMEIEIAILAVPGVSQAAVVGLADPTLDEIPVAFVVANASSDTGPLANAVMIHCATVLSRFKRPCIVHFVEALPLIYIAGKIDKKTLRHMAFERDANTTRPQKVTSDDE